MVSVAVELFTSVFVTQGSILSVTTYCTGYISLLPLFNTSLVQCKSKAARWFTGEKTVTRVQYMLSQEIYSSNRRPEFCTWLCDLCSMSLGKWLYFSVLHVWNGAISADMPPKGVVKRNSLVSVNCFEVPGPRVLKGRELQSSIKALDPSLTQIHNTNLGREIPRGTNINTV